MSVHLNIRNGNYYGFTEARLKTVVSANSLDEASIMGIVDKIIDWFRGGVKKEAIVALFQELSKPTEEYGHGHKTIKTVEKFYMLGELAKDEYKSQFKIDIHHNDDQKWSYTMKIGDHEIYNSGDIYYNDHENHFDEFCAFKTCMDFDGEFHALKDSFGLEEFINLNIECMSDEKEQRDILKNSLDDTRYSSSNLVSIEPCYDDDAKFIAKFKDGDLVFSNRASTRNEFRGDILKKALTSQQFNNLREICNHGFMTENDARLMYMAVVFKQNLLNMIGEEGMLSNKVLHILHTKEVGNTTLGRLFKLGPPPPMDSSVSLFNLPLMDNVPLN